MRTAFLGLGNMGQPMATNLARSGADLVVWSRTPAAAEPLERLGVEVATSAAAAIDSADTIIVMLANDRVVDSVLGRGTREFDRLAGRTVVQMGTTSAAYSADLGSSIEAAGGRYAEAPVSGSRTPAEEAQLVAMVAAPSGLAAEIVALVAPMCRAAVVVGEVPQAIEMKLAVNTFLITQVVGLVESFHLATTAGLNLDVFRSVLDAGPLASAVSTVKLDKLARRDFTTQASVSNVLYNARLISDMCHEVGVELRLMDEALGVFERAEMRGHGDQDMVAVIKELGPKDATAG